MEGSASIHEAVVRYVADVKSGAFPNEAVHGF
jgi:ketopantoate hydroxymethyltransferase